MNIPSLGEPGFQSPVRRSINEDIRVPEHILKDPKMPESDGLLFELAGPRSKIFLIRKPHVPEL